MADPEEPKTIYNDVCMLAEYLHKLYIDRLASGGVKLVRTKSLDNEREAQWYTMDLDKLRTARDNARNECRAEQGLPPLGRRYAMTAGSRRTFGSRRSGV